MKSIGAAQFKAQCLALLDKLESDGLVITKHGKPIAKVIPVQTEGISLIGSLKGKVKIKGDIFSTGNRWNAES